jgi:CheY-like chemotaxis protein
MDMPTVLVIDDDQGVRTAIHAILRGHGYGVFLAEDGATGLNVFRASRFDAVIVDVFMPELDGIGTLRQLRRTAPSIPLIIMSGHSVTRTANGNPDFLGMAIKLGATCALQKPFTSGQLLDALQQGMKLSQSVVPMLEMAETTAKSRRNAQRWNSRPRRAAGSFSPDQFDATKWRFGSVPAE